MTAPHAAFVLALGLALGRASQGTDEESEDSGYSTPEETTDKEALTTSMLSVVTTEALATEALATGALATGANSTSTTDENSSQLEFLLMVVIPVAVLVLLILIGILIATYFKRKRTKQEPSSQGSQSALQTYELGGENLKVPIFEEDTPSVMEIEMEELDKWMNSMNRNADYECLPTLKEEKEPNPSPSDNES